MLFLNSPEIKLKLIKIKMFRANPGESTPCTVFWYSGSPMLFLILHSQRPMRSSRQMSTVDGVVWMRISLEEKKSKRQPTVCQNPANTDIVILCMEKGVHAYCGNVKCKSIFTNSSRKLCSGLFNLIFIPVF